MQADQNANGHDDGEAGDFDRTEAKQNGIHSSAYQVQAVAA
jgi:hypothetical protein